MLEVRLRPSQGILASTHAIVAGLSAAVPLYQAETAPKAIRGTLTATYQLFITAGILVAYCISIGTREAPGSASWRIVIAIGILFALFLGITIQFMPESPRWLLRQGRDEDAKRSIQRVKRVPYDQENEDVTRMYNEQRDATDYERQLGKAGWLDCFKPQNKTLYRTIVSRLLLSSSLHVSSSDESSPAWHYLTSRSAVDRRAAFCCRPRYMFLVLTNISTLLTGANYFFYVRALLSN